MLHVLLDTNILRQDPQRKSVSFQFLGRLGHSGDLVIHIPYVVWMEFISHWGEEYVEQIQAIEKRYSEIVKKPLPTELKEDLIKQSSALISSIPEVRSWLKHKLTEWCDYVGAEIHEICPHHGEKVLDAYFEGKLPFKKKKNRNDFPDAFIFESIKDLANHVDLLNVVITDKRLRDACEKIDNVKTFERLDDFVRLKGCGIDPQPFPLQKPLCNENLDNLVEHSTVNRKGKDAPGLADGGMIRGGLGYIVSDKLPEAQGVCNPPGNLPLTGYSLEIAQGQKPKIGPGRQTRPANILRIKRSTEFFTKLIEAVLPKHFLQPSVKGVTGRRGNLFSSNEKLFLNIFTSTKSPIRQLIQ
jgi:hypothetical protein